MIYLPDRKGFVVIDQQDFEVVDPVLKPVVEKTYKEKVADYLANDKNPILAKIMNLDELTKDEQNELNNQFMNIMGTSSDFNNISNGLQLLPYIRSQIGFTDEAINNKFGSFLNSSVLNPQQLAFCNQVIEYAKINGDFTANLLQKVSPFSDVDIVGLFGSYEILKKLITGLHKPVEWKK